MFVDIEREYGAESDYKQKADDLHKRKIDIADEVFVLNVGGYIGQSTRSEIEYALSFGKPVNYLEAVWVSAKEVIVEAERVSATAETARAYLMEQGLDPDAIVKEGLERIKSISGQ
jgi:hypothetical protein